MRSRSVIGSVFAVSFVLFASPLARAALATRTACGPWTVADLPLPAAANSAVPYAVDGVSRSDVWAVGTATTPGGSLIEHWDGTSWSVVHHPEPAGYNAFFGVEARAADDVWAVGAADGVNYADPLIEHWDGKAWTPYKTSTGVTLYDVAALSAADAWAVGRSTTGPLIQHWDGSVWTPLRLPDDPFAQLLDAEAVSSSDVWAVGFDGNFPEHTLVWHYDGAVWSVVPSPSPGSADRLVSVKAVSSTEVWASGSTDADGGGYTRPLFERWDGTSWMQVDGPDPGDGNDSVSLVVDDRGLKAVGTSFSPGVPFRTRPILLRWNGSTWRVERLPVQPGTNGSVNAGVSLGAGGDVLVGTKGKTGKNKTFPIAYTNCS